MPRVTWNIPAAEKQITVELRDIYVGYMTTADVAAELGFKKWENAAKWLADLPATVVNGRKRYRVTAIAHKLYESTQEVVNA